MSTAQTSVMPAKRDASLSIRLMRSSLRLIRPATVSLSRPRTRNAAVNTSMIVSPPKANVRSPPSHPAAKYTTPPKTAVAGMAHRFHDRVAGVELSLSDIEDLLHRRLEEARQPDRER